MTRAVFFHIKFEENSSFSFYSYLIVFFKYRNQAHKKTSRSYSDYKDFCSNITEHFISYKDVVILKKRFSNIFFQLSLIDRILLLFLTILLLYTLIHLLAGISGNGNSNTIDIIVRTSLASIFGYFLNGALPKSSPVSKLSKTGTSTVIQKTSSENLSSDIIKNQIGFQTPLSTSPQTGDRFSPPPELSAPTSSYLKTRIYIVSGIGLLSLIILVFARHTPSVTPELAATVSQLRDFVASCIGFLISCGKQSNE